MEQRMYDHNEREAHLTRINTLETDLADQRRESLRLADRVALVQGYADEAHRKINEAKRLIEEVLAGDIDAGGTYESFKEAFELLGVEATREVQVTVTASWSGSVHLPYGTDLDDVSMSFTAEFDDLEGSVGWHADDYEIREG